MEPDVAPSRVPLRASFFTLNPRPYTALWRVPLGVGGFGALRKSGFKGLGFRGLGV